MFSVQLTTSRIGSHTRWIHTYSRSHGSLCGNQHNKKNTLTFAKNRSHLTKSRLEVVVKCLLIFQPLILIHRATSLHLSTVSSSTQFCAYDSLARCRAVPAPQKRLSVLLRDFSRGYGRRGRTLTEKYLDFCFPLNFDEVRIPRLMI